MTKNAPPITTAEARVLELEGVVHACTAEIERLNERFQLLASIRHPKAAEDVARRAEADELKRDLNKAQMVRCDAQVAVLEARRALIVDDVDMADVDAAKARLDEAQREYNAIVNRTKWAADERRALEHAIKSARVAKADYEESAAIIAKRIAARISEGERRRLLAGVEVA
jgi:hypothetical protein